jgi:2-C-methyl-D-erythritol 2,4-cyclodiphosphate synthase
VEIYSILNERLRIGMGIDFHSLHEGYPLILAGVTIPHDRGFHVKRSDGDPVSHAVVDAILSALNEGDIADWFNDQDGVTNARSIDYLAELHSKLLKPRNISIINIQIIIMAEKPKLKSYFPEMRQEVAKHLDLDWNRVSIQGKTFEGKGIIGEQQGIEVHAIVSLLA